MAYQSSFQETALLRPWTDMIKQIQQRQKQPRKKIFKEKHAALLGEWKEAEKQQLERNKVQLEKHKQQVKFWEKERDWAKGLGKKPGWTKSGKCQYIEPPLPKPQETDNKDGDGDSEEDSMEGKRHQGSDGED
ncbi:hypothetical protein CVT25_012361 [Psilocybe cyanescens]|uniref:Uncharacterized protein n=1 Tax=Psilocybe cyanescens TaxID=93625 RepID=A0A409W3R2_PSICY|nr:hypothetical protein CVT25_012361 [Psilocybe cyanescens]